MVEKKSGFFNPLSAGFPDTILAFNAQVTQVKFTLFSFFLS
jgi:hypothetical protein